jgi:hypothetical protein
MEAALPDVASESSASTRTDETPLPLIVDLGKHRRRDVKRLRDGRGKLVKEIGACLAELKGAGKLPAGAQPVVVLVREKRRKTALWPLA